MKKSKKYLVVLLCFCFWGIIFLLIINYENLRIQKKVAQYVLIDKFNYWKYIDYEWQKLDSVNDFDSVSEELNWKKYNIYVNNQYFRTLDYVFMNGEEYYFDDDTHSYEINQEKILFNYDTYLSLKNFNLSNFSSEDMDIVNDFLINYGRSVDDLTIQKKYLIDEENIIYVVSNYPSYYPKYTSDLFCIVFYRRNSKNYLLLNVGYIENTSNYKLSWVLDAKNKFDNFILSYTCEEVTCYEMYEYKKGKYVKAIET